MQQNYQWSFFYRGWRGWLNHAMQGLTQRESQRKPLTCANVKASGKF